MITQQSQVTSQDLENSVRYHRPQFESINEMKNLVENISKCYADEQSSGGIAASSLASTEAVSTTAEVGHDAMQHVVANG